MRRLALISLAALMLVGLPAPTRGHDVRALARPATPNAVPPECVLKTSWRPWLTPVWAFVMNFDVFTGTVGGVRNPVGCLVLWRVPFTPTDYIRVDTCATVGGMQYDAGRAYFFGGHIECKLNLMTTFNAITPTFPVTVEQTYSTMQLVGVGSITPPTTPATNTNPLLYYRPVVTTAQPVGLFVPTASATASDVYVIRSDFAGKTNLGPTFAAGSGDQIWSAKQVPSTHDLVHELNWKNSQTFNNQPPVVLRMDATTLYVGGSPLGPGFDGSLDEVIFDPADTIGPNAAGGVAVWLPIVSR